MHHLIFSEKDTFITNTLGYEDLNFGIDEILCVGTQNITTKVTYPTTTTTVYTIESITSSVCVQDFSGSLATASFFGSASYVIGTVINDDDNPVTFTVDYFSGSIVGSINGWITGSQISSSNYMGILDGFSGSIVIKSGSIPSWEQLYLQYQNWNMVWETIIASGSINGFVSGSLVTNFFGIFNGSISGFTGKILTATVQGFDTINSYKTDIINATYRDRALVQFNIDAISASMANGDIVNPQFKLKLNIAKEFNLPIKYNIYAFPISESWMMGDGYVSDNGSTYGTSWIYRDQKNGTPWITTGSSYIKSISATQSFDYQVGDINMDITNIVMGWISGTYSNNGIVLISSDEFNPTGSGMCIKFFSKDTNTIYEPILDIGWNDSVWSTGSITTSGFTTGSIPAGISGSVSSGSMISGSIWGGFTGFINLSMGDSGSASGFMSTFGLDGLISSMSINGNMIGFVSTSYHEAHKRMNCKTCQPSFNKAWGGISINGGQDQTQYQSHDIYGWGHAYNTFNQYDWWQFPSNQQLFTPGFVFNGPYATTPCQCGSGNSSLWYIDDAWWASSSYNCNPTQSHTGGNQWVSDDLSGAGPCGYGNTSYSTSSCYITMSFLMGTLTDGLFSGSTFTSSLINGYILGYGQLVGTWNEQMIIGTTITSPYPFYPFYPYAINVLFTGQYVNGLAFGAITGVSASYGLNNYGIFDGIFINGQLVGKNIHATFTGSILTSSIDYTSSISYTSNSLSPVNFNKPFVSIVQNIPSTVKAGNVIRVNVFARPEFPLKNFNRQTQFTQFLIPQYFPTSSYYAIKDNETEQIILDFDNYTGLSCDSNGNYFMLDTTGFPQERYFRILIKTTNGYLSYTFDKGNIFKIVR